MKRKIIIIAIIMLIGAICLLPNSRCNKKENIVDSRDVMNAVSIQEKREDATVCLEVITVLYEDDQYIYNVPNSCYGDITYVSFADGSRMSIKEALLNNKVTIDELIFMGAKIYRESKVSIQPIDEWIIKHIDSNLTCAAVIATLYEDNNYVYTVNNPCYIYENYVVYNDGSKYNLQEALELRKVTIDELIKKGAKINKDGKISIKPVEDIGIQPVTWYLETRNSGRMCANVLTTLYEDNNYKYSVPSSCYLNDTYVVYSNGNSYNIKKALELGKVTISELIKKGAIIYKDSKVSIKPVDDVGIQPVTWKIVKENSGKVCTQAVATLYENNDYIYSVANACVLNDTYVVFSNGEKYNIKSAVNQGKVTIDELVKELSNSGIKVYKSTIYRVKK